MKIHKVYPWFWKFHCFILSLLGMVYVVFSSDGAQEVHNFVRSFVCLFGVIVRFMCYKGSEGCCKGQKGSRRIMKSQEGSRRVKKTKEG